MEEEHIEKSLGCALRGQLEHDLTPEQDKQVDVRCSQSSQQNVSNDDMISLRSYPLPDEEEPIILSRKRMIDVVD